MTNLLRPTLLWILSWMMAFGSHFLSLTALAAGRFSPVTYRMMEQPGRGLPSGLNPYLALGFDGAETQVTQAMIEAASQRAIAILEQQGYSLTAEFQSRLTTAASRQALLAELSEASYLIRVAASQQGVTLNLSQEASRLMEAHTQQWRSFNPSMTAAELDQRARATALAEVIEKHQGKYGRAALQQRSVAISTLSDVNQRYKYDFRTGLREGRAPMLPRRGTYLANRAGYARLVLPGTGGQVVDIPLAQSQQTPMSETMRNILQGAGNYSIAAASFLLLSFTYTLGKMTFDYAQNPLAFEEIIDQYITPVYLLSFFTFGATASSHQFAQRMLVQKNIEILYDLSRNGHLFTNKPIARAQVAKSAFAGLSMTSLAFGFIASMSVHYLGEKTLSCVALLRDGPMSQADREQHEQLCDMGYFEFVENAFPQIVSVLPAIWGAKTLMALAGNIQGLRGMQGVYSATKEAFAQKSARFNNRYNDPKLRASSQRELLGGMSRGIPASVTRGTKVVKFLRTAGAITIHMAGFVILIEVMSAGGRAVWDSAGRGLSAGSKEGHLRKSFELFVADGLSLETFCRSGRDESARCMELEYIFQEMDDYNTAVDDLRLYHMRDMAVVTDNWTRYFSNSLNMYQASSLFYKDVLDQVTAQRRQQATRPFKYTTDSEGELAHQTYLQHANHPLPLFRSSPLFGVRPEYVNDSWFEGLNWTEAMAPGRWENGSAESDMGFVTENHREKIQLAQETGLWLLDQLEQSALPDFLKEHAEYIGRQLATGSLRAQISGLTLLHKSPSIASWNPALCRKNQSSAETPECLFYFAQQMMMDVLLGSAEILERGAEDLPQDRAAQALEIAEQFRSPLADTRAKGLNQLKEIVVEIGTTHSLACETQTDGLCVFRDAERLATSGPLNHRNRPDYGGYLREHSARPSGPLSLAPGHKYFMDFYTSWEQFGIDYDWYPARQEGGQMGSMSHYMLTSMLCGPDTYAENTPTLTRRLGGLIPAMPEFHPPRLPSLSGQNYCGSLANETSVYHNIEKAEGGQWHGIVDLLFNDVATSVTGGEFASWWETYATKPFENLILEKAARYGDDLKKKLRRVLVGPEGFWGGLRSSVTSFVSTGQPVSMLDSINKELDVYFWSLFYPIYTDPEVLWYEPNLPMGTDDEVETFQLEYLSRLESDLRDQLQEAVRAGVDNPERMDEAFAEVELTMHRLKQLFQGWDGTYFTMMLLGEIPEYPQLSYQGRPAWGNAFDANIVMEKVFTRLDLLVQSLKFDIKAKASFFESLQEVVNRD